MGGTLRKRKFLAPASLNGENKNICQKDEVEKFAKRAYY
jgi:hypothetical protein